MTGAGVDVATVGKPKTFGVTVPAFSLLAMVCLLEWIWGEDCACHGYTAIRGPDSILVYQEWGIRSLTARIH